MNRQPRVKRPPVDDDDRCDLCGHRFDGARLGRVHHLRRSHPAYARGLLMRLAAPLVFLAVLLTLAGLNAPPWAYLAAVAGCLGLLAVGMAGSRRERARAGARPTVPFRQLIRDGGFRFLLIPIVLALLLILANA